jgi:hypothetical protein
MKIPIVIKILIGTAFLLISRDEIRADVEPWLIDQKVTHAYDATEPWMHNGKFYHFIIEAFKVPDDILGGTCTTGFYLYFDAHSPKAYLVTASIGGISAIVDREVDVSTRKDFVEKLLPKFLAYHLSMEDVDLLDPSYLEEYLRFMKDAKYIHSADDVPNESSLKLLQGVCEKPEVSFDKDKSTWHVSFNVICMADARVEHWTFVGSLDKFVINGWNREVIIQGGKIHPNIPWG